MEADQFRSRHDHAYHVAMPLLQLRKVQAEKGVQLRRGGQSGPQHTHPLWLSWRLAFPGSHRDG
jgi:hypothetical protein